MNVTPVKFDQVLQHDAEAWALRISARWRASIESIIETGQLLHDAKASLEHGQFGKMIENDLPFGARTAQMLMAIADDKRLSNPKHVSHLPPAWGTLHALTKLTDDEFDRAIEQKIIRPDMERKDVEIIRPTPRRERAEPTSGEERAAPSQPEHHSEGTQRDQAAGDHPKADGEPDAVNAPLSEPESVTPSVGDSGSPAAHMAGRVHPAGDHDFSPTPPWATRALVERVLRHAGREGHCKFQTAREPACGEGHMAEVLREYFRSVFASDIDPTRGYADHIGDFLDPKANINPPADWIITNPPFGDNVLPFMKRALEMAGTGVAMFLQLRYLEGVERYEQIYKDRPPTIIAPFVERVPLVMGRYAPDASTTTAFMWLVWFKGASPKAPFWIPPGCRSALTRPDDAARFTQSPVVKIVRPVSEPPPPQPASPPADADDALDIPEFLRRTA